MKRHENEDYQGHSSAAAIVLAAGLAACGTTIAPAAAPKATITVTSTPTPTPTVTKTVVQAPTRVVYVPAAAPAGPALTNCGGDVLAGPNTSCPFALNVELADGIPQLLLLRRILE